MVLKRKRSECEFASIFSSEQAHGSGSFNFNSMSAMDTARRGFFAPRLSAPSHLPSRTMKRFRDNRPSESQVYQHTLDVLYSAQRRAHEPQHVQSAEVPRTDGPTQTHAQRHQTSQQRSLHSFWNLPPGPATSATSLASSPASSTMSPPSPALVPRSIANNCEDCGVGLRGGDGDAAMMEVDEYGLSSEDHTCGACGKTVCFSCSISNLGEHRRCLPCAGPRAGGGDNSWLRR